MTRYLAPGTILAGILTITLALATAFVWLGTAQPWLGVDLGLRDDGAVVIRSADPAGPLAGSAGARLVAIGTPGGGWMAIEPDDLVEEPDTLGDADRLRRFFDRQGRLHDFLAAGPLDVQIDQNGALRTLQTIPAPARPLGDLGWRFWTQIGVGVVGLALAAWVVALRPRDAAAWMLLVTGAGLAAAAQAAALYSTRELALGAGVFGAASRLNSFGSLLFGIGMVTLFLIYPRRLVRGAALWLPAAVIGAGIFYVIAMDWPANVPLVQAMIAAIMAVLLAAIAAQVWINRRDPAARAMMGWLGMSVAIGAGAFVLTSIVPNLLGQPPIVQQSTAFLFFLVIYAGVALGVARYRLFDLADWSVGLLFYASGVALLLMLDALLVFGLALDRLPALSLSLTLVCLTYLPMRDRVAGWQRRAAVLPPEELYRRITEISHAGDGAAQLARSRSLWSDLFRPLAIRPLPATEVRAAALADEGRSLLVPAVAGLPALRLDMAGQGARLFSSRDLAQAATISQLLDDTLTRHNRYTQAVATERARINRDMHDNIGILLLSALHNDDPTRKDALIRQTLTDLREIVSKPTQEPWQVQHLLADLRAEVADVLEAAGITLVWDETGVPDIRIPPQNALTLRALVREGVSNILRHAGASVARVEVSQADGLLSVSIADDGCGFDARACDPGNGLVNLRSRMSPFGAALRVETSASGTTVSATIPLDAVAA